MNTIDFKPVFRNRIGFNNMTDMLDNIFGTNHYGHESNYPLYNIESIDKNSYTISLAVPGFKDQELEIKLEQDILTIHGEKKAPQEKPNYIYQGISHASFKRKFVLAEHVSVTDAKLTDGLLTIHLVKKIPEALEPKTIAIN